MVLLGCLVALLSSCSAVEEEPFVPIAGGPDCISAVIEPAAGSGPYYAVLPYNNYAKRTDEGIYLWLSQRKYANTNDIAFGGVPMAGKYIDGNIQFRNIFGLLKVTFTSAVPVKIKQIALHDLGGNMLWGGCNIPVKADTLAYDEMTLKNGDNTIRMKWNTSSALAEAPRLSTSSRCLPARGMCRSIALLRSPQLRRRAATTWIISSIQARCRFLTVWLTPSLSARAIDG